MHIKYKSITILRNNLNARRKHRLSILRYELNFLDRNPVFQAKYIKWLLRVCLLYFFPAKLQEISTAFPLNSFKNQKLGAIPNF